MAASRSKILALLLLVLLTGDQRASAGVACETTVECEAKLRPGSVCRDDDESPGQKFCTNPFVGGCLRRMLGEDKARLRVCNSDDAPGAEEAGLCAKSALDYPEVRISPNNWESAMFYGWILQIILSELVDVPTTIETGVGRNGTRPLSFYDEKNSFSYGKVVNDFEALYRSNDLGGDCTKTDRPCAHVLPEVWQANRKAYIDETQIERDGSGMVGTVAWYVPDFVSKMDPSLTHHWGLQGKTNRKKVAETFLRPSTWGYYCREISPTNCTADGKNGTASRPPVDEEEAGRYHAGDLYLGHFGATKENDCSDGKNCTGHLVDYPCGWSAYTETQIYWNDINLDTKVQGKNGYSYGEILQIYAASKATQSPAMFVWWYPDPVIDEYNLEEVTLTKTTSACLENRPDPEGGRCNADMATLRGKEVGSCGYNTHYLQKIYSSSLRNQAYETGEASRSPAHETLRNFRISDISLRDMMLSWVERGVDKYGYDPREAACQWVVENLNAKDKLTRFIPATYPRQVVEQSYNTPMLRAALAFACIAVAAVLVVSAAVVKFRAEKVIKSAQLSFLYLLCLGLLLISIAAVVYATPPLTATCTARSWLKNLGFTLSLVPLLIKVAAINKITKEAQRMRRIKISKRDLHGSVAVAILLVTVVLVVWSVVDPPTSYDERSLVSENSTVKTQKSCASSSNGWMMGWFAWEGLLILFAALLAFQSRKTPSDFNESRQLGNMAYANFFFMVSRLLVYIMPSEILEPHTSTGLNSFLLAGGSLVNLSVYFGPKFWFIHNPEKPPFDKQFRRFTRLSKRGHVPKRFGSFGKGENGRTPRGSELTEDSGQTDKTNAKRRVSVREHISSLEANGDGQEYEIEQCNSLDGHEGCTTRGPAPTENNMEDDDDILVSGPSEPTPCPAYSSHPLAKSSSSNMLADDSGQVDKANVKRRVIFRESISSLDTNADCMENEIEQGKSLDVHEGCTIKGPAPAANSMEDHDDFVVSGPSEPTHCIAFSSHPLAKSSSSNMLAEDSEQTDKTNVSVREHISSLEVNGDWQENGIEHTNSLDGHEGGTTTNGPAPAEKSMEGDNEDYPANNNPSPLNAMQEDVTKLLCSYVGKDDVVEDNSTLTESF